MHDRFAQFLKDRAAETYPEPSSPGHESITAQMLPETVKRLQPGAEVLDVGCGQGVALEHFKQLGFQAIGTTLNETDRKVLEEKGFTVWVAWQEDLPEQWTERFDLVWARHVIEHSIMPCWTLHEFKRVLKPGGWLYVEVPMPDTECHHEHNLNHYSCLTASGWYSLISRAGFTIVECRKWALTTPAGPDEYHSYLCHK